MGSAALTIFLALLPSTIQAQQATVFKSSTGKVFLYGMQPHSKVSVDIQGDFTETIKANSCGLVVIRPSSTFSLGTFSIDGQTINSSSITSVRSLLFDCTQMTNYPAVFKTSTGEVAIKKTPGTNYTVTYLNHKVTRQVQVNSCGYAVLKNVTISSLNLPTATGGRADFAYTSLPSAKPLSCVKGVLYFPVGFDPKSAIASSTAQSTTTTSNTAATTQQTTTISSQTAQPVAVKSGNSLIISSIPPGTYTVTNYSNPQQSKVYTVTLKGCLVSDRTTIGSPSKFLVSRQGLTFPIDWASLTTIPGAAVPQC